MIRKKGLIPLVIVGIIVIGFGGLFVTKTHITAATIYYKELEGGFYALQTFDGQWYDPNNLPEKYWQNNTNIFIIFRISDNQISFHMFAPLVDIIYITDSI